MSRKIEVRNWYEEPTAWGYTKRHLDMALMLLKEGITPHELKEHCHDFEWVAKILKDDLDKQIEKAVKDAAARGLNGRHI